MKFRVTINKDGTKDEDRIIEAESRFSVYEQMKKDGITVVRLEEIGWVPHLPQWLFMTIGTGISKNEIIRFAKNLSAMINAGLPLSRALSIIERQSNNKSLQKVSSSLSASVKAGSSFRDALLNYPKIFPELFISMVRAGEESGSLGKALTIISRQMERAEELLHKIRSAMIYPIIVIIAIVIIGILMLIFVMPTLIGTFTELGVELPLATQYLISISNFLSHNVKTVFGILIIILLTGINFFRSHKGNTLLINISLPIPIIGEIIRETYSARTARTLSSLLASGVPVLEALSITREVVHTNKFANVIEKAEQYVKKGGSVSLAFSENTNLYPILFSDMLLVGEETGKSTEMLEELADLYENDVSEKTKDLSTIVEPILMLFVGAIVGVFAVAMIEPIYSISSAF